MAVRLIPTWKEDRVKAFIGFLFHSIQHSVKPGGTSAAVPPTGYKEQQITSMLITTDKKSKPCNKNLIARNRRKKPSCDNDSSVNGGSRWTSIADRTLNISLSHLVEPLRLFHPTLLIVNQALKTSVFKNHRVFNTGDENFLVFFSASFASLRPLRPLRPLRL